MTRKVTSYRLPEMTVNQIKQLAESTGSSDANVISIAIDRLHKQEIAMSFNPFDDEEIESFQDVVLATPDCPGAESFRLKDHYEVHVRSADTSADFPDPVQAWLYSHGFQRAVDPQRGPFYYR
jgi:NADH/NAD ratio-sensing transcriptional regulator Rex